MVHLKTKLIALCLFFSMGVATAQTDKEEVAETFKETRIVNGHSVETTDEGDLNLIITHRFGAIDGGAYEWFGLDAATMRIGLDYGVTRNFTVGWGRSTLEKTYDAYGKYRLLRQNNTTPISLTAFGSVALNTLRFNEDEKTYKTFGHRLFYTGQVLLARKFSDRFSFQLMPTWIHRNLVETSTESNDVFSLGAASRIQLSKTIALNVEYFYVPSGQLSPQMINNASVGLEFETNGHTFQIHFSNSRGMIEKFFIAETLGDNGALNSDIHFGFNISRVFRVKGKKRE